MRRSTLAVGLGVALVGLAYFLWLGEVVWPVDDAYITQHNAKYLFGHDPAWPDATWLDGTTSLVHVGAIGLLALVVPVAIAQCAVTIAASAFYAMGLAELAKTFGLGRLPSAGLVALGLLTAGVAHQLLNGLETGLALAVVTWTLVALRWSEPKLVPLFPVLLGIAPFVRPELYAFSLLLFASFARTRPRPELVKASLWAVGVWLPLFAILLLSTDSPVPTTIEAKRVFFAEGCLPLRDKLPRWGTSLGGGIAVLGPVVAGVFLLPFLRHGRALLAFVAVFLGAYLWQFPDALEHYEHRYLYVLLPLALWGIAGMAAGPRTWVGLALGAVSLVFGVMTFRAAWTKHQDTLSLTRIELYGVAEWLRHNAAPGSTVLVHDAGYVAAVPGLTFVDLVGLKTPASVDVHREWTWATCGRKRLIADDLIARAARPDYWILREGWDRAWGLNDGFRRRGWDVTRVDDSRFGAVYGVFKLTPPPP